MRGPFSIGTWLAAAALALGGCSDPPAEERAAVPAPVPAAAPAAPVVPEPAPPPPEAEAVAKALSDIHAFNAAAAEEMAGIERAEQEIRRAASRAADAAGRSGSGADGRRSSGQVAAARAEAERARARLTAGFGAFQTSSAERTAQLDAALEQCAGMEALKATEACASLTAEQPVLAQTIAALAERYQAADSAWRQEQTKLDEASAVIALGR